MKNTYSGKDFLGEKKIDSLLSAVKETQDLLKNEKNIDLILMFAPSKEFVLPEYIPDYYSERKGKNLNLDVFIKKCKEKRINYIDFNSILDSLKKSSKYPVYYKKGEHWSYISMIQAGINMVSYIEKVRRVDMPDIQISSIEVSDTARHFDNDQGDAMNLLFSSSDEKFYYPKLKFNSSLKHKPRVLAIADCYYQQFYQSPIADSCFFNGGDLWFYNRQSQSKITGYKNILDIDKFETLNNQEVIIHMITNHNLKDFGFGIFEELELMVNKSKYEEYKKELELKNKLFNEEVQKVISRIKSDKKWLEQVKNDAKNRGLTTDKMIERTAKYVVNNR